MRIAIVLIWFALSPTIAIADDIADVEATADRYRTAFNENSAEAMALFMVDGILAFIDPIPVLNDGKANLKQFFTGQFDLTEWVKVVATGPRTTRVTGATAVIAQNTAYMWKPVDGAAESMFVNSFEIWTKVGGEWMLAGIMVSALPHGTAP